MDELVSRKPLAGFLFSELNGRSTCKRVVDFNSLSHPSSEIPDSDNILSHDVISKVRSKSRKNRKLLLG